MFNKYILFLFLFVSTQIISQENLTDSLKNYWLQQVEINSKRLNLGEANNRISKDNLENVLGTNGFSLIRKGVFFAQDVYADGLKKGDINVVIDGERYHSACPNRMDSPLTRVNPLDLESVSLNKTSSNIQSGLGGVVKFNRSSISEIMKIQAAISTLAGAQNGFDLATSADYSNHRISLRYANGSPYVDGDKNSFSDSYGFKENYNFKLVEASVRGQLNSISYGFSAAYTENVSFPYLQMDERFNRVYSAYLRYDDHKIYFNYTNHVMDNDLRINTMLMKTTAKNLTIGAIGNFYEVIFRNWDANNFFHNAMMHIDNDLIPNVNSYNANLFKSIDLEKIRLYGKIGFSYQMIGDKSREEFYKKYFEEVNLSRFFPTFSLGLSHLYAINNSFGIGGMIEVNSESPETESLFISVQKPMGKPSWTGNSNLKQPFKGTLRGSITYENVNLEMFGSKVWNYNNLARQTVMQMPFLTYTNVDALLLGSNLNVNYKFIVVDASYIWAKNSTNNSPLAEMPPLKISTKIISPEYYGFVTYLKHLYNNAQIRVDDLLNETKSGAWNKLDIGLMYNFNGIEISLDVENLLNANYYQHLSFMRDPFAAGNKVYEPGRIFRITFKTNQIL
ncbi:MAG: hypothetical protein IPM32_13190 [Ignavibacteriae bacterium]|nr:hypothetical protein [Ignavibacteriota bacterium]